MRLPILDVVTPRRLNTRLHTFPQTPNFVSRCIGTTSVSAQPSQADIEESHGRSTSRLKICQWSREMPLYASTDYPLFLSNMPANFKQLQWMSPSRLVESCLLHPPCLISNFPHSRFNLSRILMTSRFPFKAKDIVIDRAPRLSISVNRDTAMLH